MKKYYKWAYWEWKAIITVKSVVAFVIVCIYGLISMAIFGEDSRASLLESILVLAGSILISNFIVNKFLKKRNNRRK